jgi:octopine/nopaline transport system permease protein
VTIKEMTFIANDEIHKTYLTVPIFLCAAVMYLLLNFILSRFFAYVEHRLTPHLRVMPETARPQPAIVG